MTHTRRTTVDHFFDLTTSEQYDHHTAYRSKPVRITNVWVSVVDGSVTSVRLYGYPILRSGRLGQVRAEIWTSVREERTAALLRAHGIES